MNSNEVKQARRYRPTGRRSSPAQLATAEWLMSRDLYPAWDAEARAGALHDNNLNTLRVVFRKMDPQTRGRERWVPRL